MLDKRLLIIDDDVKVADLVSQVAQQAGFETRTTHNDLSFISTFERFRPDVVVIDIMMPGMDGFEVLQFLHSRQSNARIVIISGDRQFREMAGKMGEGLGLFVDTMLPKPFRLHELRLALREIKFCLPEESLTDLSTLVKSSSTW